MSGIPGGGSLLFTFWYCLNFLQPLPCLTISRDIKTTNKWDLYPEHFKKERVIVAIVLQLFTWTISPLSKMTEEEEGDRMQIR